MRKKQRQTQKENKEEIAQMKKKQTQKQRESKDEIYIDRETEII